MSKFELTGSFDSPTSPAMIEAIKELRQCWTDYEHREMMPYGPQSGYVMVELLKGGEVEWIFHLEERADGSIDVESNQDFSYQE